MVCAQKAYFVIIVWNTSLQQFRIHGIILFFAVAVAVVVFVVVVVVLLIDWFIYIVYVFQNKIRNMEY